PPTDPPFLRWIPPNTHGAIVTRREYPTPASQETHRGHCTAVSEDVTCATKCATVRPAEWYAEVPYRQTTISAARGQVATVRRKPQRVDRAFVLRPENPFTASHPLI